MTMLTTFQYTTNEGEPDLNTYVTDESGVYSLIDETGNLIIEG